MKILSWACADETISIVASLHNKRCERHTLTVPRLFSTEGALAVDNVDIFGNPFTASSYRPPFTPGLLDAACDLAVIQNEVANYNFDVLELGTEDSLGIRREQYQRLQAWQDALPPHLRTEHNPTPGTGFLKYVEPTLFYPPSTHKRPQHPHRRRRSPPAAPPQPQTGVPQARHAARPLHHPLPTHRLPHRTALPHAPDRVIDAVSLQPVPSLPRAHPLAARPAERRALRTRSCRPPPLCR
jgi:hypothetical protein